MIHCNLIAFIACRACVNDQVSDSFVPFIALSTILKYSKPELELRVKIISVDNLLTSLFLLIYINMYIYLHILVKFCSYHLT